MNRKLLTVIVSGALALPMAAQAVDFSVSGHINRALLFGDDEITGADNNVTHTDGGASPSRFRVTGSGELDNGVTAGVNLEYGVGARKADGNPNLRHSAVYLSGAFGKLTLGHTSQATDGIAYSSYDNHAWLAGIEIGCDFCSGLPTYGGGRAEVIRYDTPSIGVGTVGVSTDGDDFWDAALRVDGSVGDGGYQLKVGYGHTDDQQDNLVVSGAVSFGGMHANAAWGQTDPDASSEGKQDYLHFGIGYNIGETSIAATYTDHDVENGVQSWGVGVGHGMGPVQLYAGYKHLNLDEETAARGDHGFFVVGSRIRFN